ncbi:guanylate kinase [Parelusimicrobium proximum]|uniref:guanylate kinase n=1 Tax=Parelusimicrobium proximum TaxID=3228953 RepID=UPI003D175D0F
MSTFPLIVSSPSGGGKTTVVNAVLSSDNTVSRVITATTRAPRKGEIDGKDYHFWTEERFSQAVKNGEMAEWAQVMANWYGIPITSVSSIVTEGKVPIMVIDVQGAETVKKVFPDAVSVFLLPPSMTELEKRILARNDGTKNIDLRLRTAAEEIKKAETYDYILVNDDLDETIENLKKIIFAEKNKTKRIYPSLKKRKLV